MTEATGVPIAASIVPAVKPGWQTTEFWKSVVVSACGLLMASGIIGPNSPTAVIVGMIAAAASSGAYAISRGMTKAGS